MNAFVRPSHPAAAFGLVLSAALLLVGAPENVRAQSMHVESLAATCAACHGTNGRAVEGSAIPSLAGRPREQLQQQLLAFRDGSREATVMHQISKGYSPAQIEQLAAWFAARK